MEDPARTTDTSIQTRLTRFVDRTAGWALDLIADALILLALVGLGWVTVTLAIDLVQALADPGRQDVLPQVILDVLTIFIFLEIFHSFLDFLRTKMVELGNLADITLAIIFREVWVGLFSKELHWQEIIAVAALIVAVGLVRVFAGSRTLSLGRRHGPVAADAAGDLRVAPDPHQTTYPPQDA